MSATRASWWRDIVARHRPLAVLLPTSLIAYAVIALGHGAGTAAPANQGLLAPVIDSLATIPAVRLAWWLWLAAALVVLERLARRIGASDQAVIAVGAVLVALPVTFWAIGWGGTDGPLLLAGALGVWLASECADGRRRGWALVLTVLLAGAFGPASVLLGILVLLQLLVAASASPLRRPRLVLTGVAAFAGSLVLPAVAVTIGAGVLPGTQTATSGDTVGTLGSIRGVLNAMVDLGLQSVAARGIGLPGAPEYVFAMLGWVVIAGVLVAFFQLARRSPKAPIVVSAAATVLLAGPVLLLWLRVLSGEWLVLTGAGTAVLLPAFVAVTATVIRNRTAAWIVTGWSVVVIVAEMVLVVVATG